MNTIELLNYGKKMLGNNLLYDAQLILAHCLKLKPAEVVLNRKNIKTKQKYMYQKMLNKRKKGIPTAYLLGETEFMGLKFYIDKSVMIPRQETEILVETAIKIAFHLSILDIGTGCGNIAISLAKYLPDAKIVAVDISKNALKIAKKNARLHNVSGRITFLQSNLFNLLPSTFYLLPSFDLIVSNPPYIKTAELKKLQKEIWYEPKIAFDGSFDGLKFYRKIIAESKKYLKKNGCLMFEIGYHHSSAIKKIMLENGYKNITIKNDYSQQPRVIYGQNYN
ncbi:MAG: peptide chain release factor N(5)-glutamine methyltransferase [Elusimicrobiota bacterium]